MIESFANHAFVLQAKDKTFASMRNTAYMTNKSQLFMSQIVPKGPPTFDYESIHNACLCHLLLVYQDSTSFIHITILTF